MSAVPKPAGSFAADRFGGGRFAGRFALAALATWRVTHLLAEEDGPADAVVRLRQRAGSSWSGDLLDCFYCLSVWVSVPCSVGLAGRHRANPLWYLAVSGAACLLEQATRPAHDPRPHGAQPYGAQPNGPQPYAAHQHDRHLYGGGNGNRTGSGAVIRKDGTMSCCGQKRSELRGRQATSPPPASAAPAVPASVPGIAGSPATTQSQLRSFLARKAMAVQGTRLSRIRSTGKG